MKRFYKFLTAATVVFAHTLTLANSFPSKPITIIVPFAAGGVTDVLTREVAKAMAANLGTTVIVENRPGVGGSLGMEFLKRSSPDGYTLGVTTNGNMAANLILYKNINYSPTEDFDQLSVMFSVPYLIISSGSSGIDSANDLIIKTKSTTPLSMANGGYGTAVHLMAESFSKSIGANIQHVPYKGEAPAVADVLGGHSDLGISSYSSVSQHIVTKKINVLAVTAPHRMEMLPNTPTLKELGIKQEVTGAWFGLAAPKNLPHEISSALSKSISASLKHPDVVKKIKGIGGALINMPPQDSHNYVESEMPRWASVVKSANITPQ